MPTTSTTIDIPALIEAAKTAGQSILSFYNQDFAIETKADDSPVTPADKASDQIITDFLQRAYPGIPVLSEEGNIPEYDVRKHWKQFWCVDPLDGTKEFIKKTDEFTINIALIENEAPVFGLIYAPALRLLYYGTPTGGSYKIKDVTKNTEPEQLYPKPELTNSIAIAASRSKNPDELEDYCQKLERQGKVLTLIQAGSALKFGYLAEGKMDRYPRFAPSMEWDTAAGQAIAMGIGKNVYTATEHQVLTYNRPNLNNPHFICQ